MSKRQKRLKEKTISDILDKVALWRALYNGKINEKTGKFVRINHWIGAEKIGISKKSMDDYLLQIRQGKQLGFDFKAHKNSKIGVLRQFVKAKRQLLKNEKHGISLN